MPTRDATAMLVALCDEETLLVFAAMVASTGTGEPRTVSSGGRSTRTTTYITATGASHRTGLTVDAAANALRRLERCGLARCGDGGDGWCTDLQAIADAARVGGDDPRSGD